jgi:hypothetical protein
MLLYERETLKYVRREANEILGVAARLYGDVMKICACESPSCRQAFEDRI